MNELLASGITNAGKDKISDNVESITSLKPCCVVMDDSVCCQITFTEL